MPARRHFGSVRKLPSGRYQASYWHNVIRHVLSDALIRDGGDGVVQDGGWVTI